MNNILITGPTGKIGSRVVEQLAGRPGVRALAHSDDSAAKLAAVEVDVVRGSLRDRASLDVALDGIDALFLLAPFLPDQGDVEVGVLEAARDAGVKRVVKLSTLLQSRPLAIARGHAQAAAALPGLGFQHVSILQADNFMDDELEAIDLVRQGMLIASSGDARISFVDARDVAAVAVAELTADVPAGGDLVVTGADALTYAEFAQRLGAALSIPLEHISPPDAEFAAALLAAGLPDELAEGLAEMYVSIRESGLTHEPTDVVARLTGRDPRTPEDFAREVLAPALGAVAA